MLPLNPQDTRSETARSHNYAKYNTPLTDREIQVLALISCGWQHKEVAQQLGISLQTVKNHAAAIMTKLGARNMTHAVRLYYSPREEVA